FTTKEALMASLNELIVLNGRLDADAARLRRLRLYRDGDQPLAFLSPGDRDKLKGRLDRLAVNLPRLMVRSVADRLQVTGFTSGMDAEPDLGLWELWRRDRKSTRLNSSHVKISYAVFCLKTERTV